MFFYFLQKKFKIQLNYDMSTSVQISKRALDLSIPSSLTNEIPHLSIYDILNQHLRTDWSRDFVGKTKAYYNRDYEGVKVMNGVTSPNYGPRVIQFSDPDENQIYNVSFGKINFDVDGALETEIDYLMHEMNRYLSKLYPDDFNTLITLTKAERQSYINEALHMIHSYFDTDQLLSDDDYEDLYVKNRFLTGITGIRSYTGVVKQESLLSQLIIDPDTKVYSGAEIYIDELGNCCVSNPQTIKTQALKSLNTNYYAYYSQNFLAKKLVQTLNGKITQNNLLDFLDQGQEILTINSGIYKSFRPYYELKEESFADILRNVLEGCSHHNVNINQWYKFGIESGQLADNVPLQTFKNMELSGLDSTLNLGSGKQIGLITNITEAGITNIVPSYFGEKPNIQTICNLANRYIATKEDFKDLSDLQIIHFGDYEFSYKYSIAVGNIIYSALTSLTSASLDTQRSFETFFQSSDTFQVKASIYQNDDLIFEGFLKKEFFAEKDLSKAVRKLTGTDFDKKFRFENILNHARCIKDLQDIDLKLNAKFNVKFELLILRDADFANDLNLYVLPKTHGVTEDDSLVVSIDSQTGICTVWYNYVDPTLNNPVEFQGDTRTGRLSSVSLDHGIEASQVENGSKITLTLKGKDWTNTFELDVANRTIVNVNNSAEAGATFLDQITTFTEYKNFTDTLLVKGNIRVQGEILQNRVYSTVFITPNAVYDLANTVNVVELSILDITDLESLILNNTNVASDQYLTAQGTYKNVIKYVYTELPIKLDVKSLTIGNLVDALYENISDVDYYELSTYPCYFYSNNMLRLDTDIRDQILEQGVITAMIIDNYGNRIPVTVYKAYMQDGYCYVHLREAVEGLTQKENLTGYLILDRKTTSDGLDTTVKIDQRPIKSRQLLQHKKQYYVYNFTWDELTQNNVNYLFDNIFTGNTNDFADDTIISKSTRIPKTLSMYGQLTLLDLDVQNTTTAKLIKDLVTENKSLYLDSSLLTLRHIPLNLHNLVHNERYQSYSYTYKDTIPAYANLYYVQGYTYGPLDDLINAENNRELSLVDIQDLYSRRFVVWGDVIWDKSYKSTTVRNLRTIWSGYFTNFEIYKTDDLLPAEPIIQANVLSLNDLSAQEIINYQYSDNAGVPHINWKLNLLPKVLDENVKTIIWIDNYSNNKLLNDESVQEFDLTKSNRDLIPSGYYLNLNRLGLNDVNKLETIEINIEKIDCNGVDTVYVKNSNDITYRWHSSNNLYKATMQAPNGETAGFENDTDYNILLPYLQLHLKGVNDEPVGLYNALGLQDKYLELLLEVYTYQYYTCNILGFDQDHLDVLTAKSVLDSYAPYYLSRLYKSNNVETLEKWNEYHERTKDITKATKVLDQKSIRFTDLIKFITDQTYYIPGIAAVTESGDVEIYTYRFKLENNKLYIYRNVLVQNFNSDLLKSLLGGPTQFQFKESQRNTYLTRLYRYQTWIPENFTGDFIKLDLNVDTSRIEDYETSITTEVLNIKNDVAHLKDVCSSCEVEDPDKLITTDKRAVQLSRADINFKEYLPVTVQLSTTTPESEDSDLQRCVMHFNQDLQLKPAGYMYLFDIVAPDRRSIYSPDRETKIVDRSYEIDNLHILAFKEEQDLLQFVLQDSSKSAISNILALIESIKPTAKGVTNQQVTNNVLNFGLMWTDPGVEIGYTFYKRKFMAEFTISGVDTTNLKLKDSSLVDDEDFSLTDHISVGDQVQIMLLDDIASTTESTQTTLRLGADSNLYVGPYRVIYEESTTRADNVNTTAEAIQKVILSGPGNLVYVEINLSTGGCTISKPYKFSNEQVYVHEQGGNLVYYNPARKCMTALCSTQLYIAHAQDNNPAENLGDPSEDLTLATSTIAPSMSKHVEQTLSATHSNWYNFDKTGITDEQTTTVVDENANVPRSSGDVPEEELHGESDTIVEGGEPTRIYENIKVADGILNFDNFDRIFLSDEEGNTEPEWRALPDEAEMFDASNHPDAFRVVADGTMSTFDVDMVDDTNLRLFIREALKPLFNNASEQGVYTYAATMDEMKEPVDVATFAVAQKLLHVKLGQTVDLTTCPIFVPQFGDYDIPIYFNDVEEPKWQKAKILTGSTDTNILNASTDQLRDLARCLLPFDYTVRKVPKITSYAKNSKNLVLWDQDTGTLTIMDKLGNLKKRIAIQDIGYRSILMDTLRNGSRSYSVPNRVYAIDTSLIELYKTTANKQVSVTVGTAEDGSEIKNGIYEIFESGKPLHLPTIFANVSDSDIQTAFGDSPNLDAAKKLVHFAKDATQYNAWRSDSIYMDYLAPDGCSFVSFKDTQHVCNMNFLVVVLRTLGKTTEANLLGQLQVGYQELVPNVIKGVPYANSAAQGEFTKLRGITSISTTGLGVHGFESCVTTSGIELTSSMIHIYGQFTVPTTDEFNSLRGKIQAAVAADATADPNNLDANVDARMSTIQNEILMHLKEFVGEDVSQLPNGGTYPFKLTVDLNDNYKVTPVCVADVKLVRDSSPILALKSNEEDITAITPDGSFPLGDPTNAYINDPSAEANIPSGGIQTGLILVYDALKTLGSFGDVTVDGSSISVSLKSVSVRNADTYYSTVSRVEDNEIYLQEDVLLMEPSQQVSAIVFAKSPLKDNFQFGYGEITNLEYIPAAQTLFEVPNKDNADFATYENRQSDYEVDASNNSVFKYQRPSIFEGLYPTWEDIKNGVGDTAANNKRSKFYKTKLTTKSSVVEGETVEVVTAEEPTYLTNSNGRYIYRILPVIQNYGGGQLVYRKSEGIVQGPDNTPVAGTGTVANEGINLEFIGSAQNLIGNHILSDARTYRKSYKKVNSENKYQRIPALVSEPRNAVLNEPYQVNQITLTGNYNDSKVDVYDDYILLTVKKNANSEKLLESFYKGQPSSAFAVANKIQLQKLIGSQSVDVDLPTLLADMLNDPSTKFAFEATANEPTLQPDVLLSSTNVNPVTDVVDNKIQVSVYETTTVTKGNRTGTHEKLYTSGIITGNWTVLQQNLTIDSLGLRIVNATPNLPKLKPITSFATRVSKDKDLIINTINDELYIPEQGYGQALLGSYSLPNSEDHHFEAGIFYDFSHSTKNKNGSTFKLVNAQGELLQTDMPRMVYRSFAQANVALDLELPTKDTIADINHPVLIDLSQFDVTTQSIQFESNRQIRQFEFSTNYVTDDNDTSRVDFNYKLFRSNLKFCAKFAWSELGPDVDNPRVFEVPNDVIDSLGYTRVFQNFAIPINYQYRDTSSKFVRTTSGALRDLTRLAANQDGEILYMSRAGEYTTDVTINDPIPASRFRTQLNWLNVQGDTIDSILSTNFFITKTSLSIDYLNCQVNVVNEGRVRALICDIDPNQAYTIYSTVNNPDWGVDYLPFKWNFNTKQVLVRYKNNSNGMYNYIYLYDKNGDLVSKIYLSVPSRSTDLLCLDMRA